MATVENAHGREREHQRGLAADAIAEVAEERGADRPRQKRDAKGGERGERGGGRVGRRKEQPGKNEHCRGRVNVEIEELDGGADEAGEQHLARRIDRRMGPGGDRAHGYSGP